MKVGLICSDPFYFHGGIQEHVKALYKVLKSKNVDTKIIVPRYRKEESYGEDVILLGKSITFSSNATRATISFCPNMLHIKEVLERECFDILHFHNHGIFLSSQILSLSTITNVLTIHVLPDASLLYKVFSPLIYPFSKTIIPKLDGIITVSKIHLDFFSNFFKFYDGSISVIPNGIDTEKFKPDNEKIDEFLDGKVNILFVGRIDKRKGLSYLIRAFDIVKKNYENTRLIVVGSGYDKSKCERIVEEKNIKDVVFVGAQDSKEIPKYYATCDIFCSPALYGEGFGIVLLEAMASGKPVVGFANLGYKQVINDSQASKFLVEPMNIKALAESLMNLVKDEKLREELGKWGLEEAKKYSWDIIGERILDFYKSIMV